MQKTMLSSEVGGIAPAFLSQVKIMNFTRQYHNPLELIEQWGRNNVDLSHIEYDPTLKHGQYSIIRQCGHDGTLFFTVEMMQKALLPLINKQSYWKKNTPKNWDDVIDIRYKIGRMKHATVFGKVKLQCGTYPGQRERIRIPVICEIITKENHAS